MRLGVKLAWLSASLTAVVVLPTFLELSLQSRAVITSSIVDQLRVNQQTLIRNQRTTLQELLRSARFLTQQGFIPYLESAPGQPLDPNLALTAADNLRRIVPLLGTDFAAITTRSGRVFAGAALGGDPAAAPAPGTDLSALPAVRTVLDSTAPADTFGLAILQYAKSLHQVAVAPLVLSGYTVGSVLVGERIDSVLTRAAPNGDVVVTAGTSQIAGTRHLAAGDLAALVGSGVSEGHQGVVVMGGQNVIVAPLTLGGMQDGTAATLWLTQSAAPTVAVVMTTLAKNFLLFAIVAVILAGVGAAGVARSVLRPFDRFVAYIQSGVEPSRLDTQFEDADAPPEVRTLNASFSALMASLSKERLQLERRTTELAAANSGLREEVRERERVELALRESEAQLRQSQKLEAIGTLAGGIAHDFNNLLTVISGYSQLALMRSGKESAGSADLQQVIDAADRAANLTHQLLAFGRKQVLQPSVLDLAQVVNGVAPMLKRLIGEHIELRIEASDDLGRILADRGQLEQVIINLVVNARDAMPGGGVVTIRTSNAGGDDAPRAVSLAVTDTGSGIPDEIRERIFEPFFTTKDVGKGTGLGLAMVYGIVKQSGGTLDVASRVGEGTTFTIVMPVVEDMGSGGGPIQTSDEMPRGTEIILLVEDEDEVRTLARRALEAAGYTVIAASGAEQALELLVGARVDLLLTDLVMPHMSGSQLVKEARIRAGEPSPVVVYMSGYADDALSTLELDPNVTLLRKPFTPMVLTRIVRDALDASLEGRHAAAD